MEHFKAKWCKPICYVLVPTFILLHVLRFAIEDLKLFENSVFKEFSVNALLGYWLFPMCLGCLVGFIVIFLVLVILRKAQSKQL